MEKASHTSVNSSSVTEKPYTEAILWMFQQFFDILLGQPTLVGQ
jgi:hypothetical protein